MPTNPTILRVTFAERVALDVDTLPDGQWVYQTDEEAGYFQLRDGEWESDDERAFQNFGTLTVGEAIPEIYDFVMSVYGALVPSQAHQAGIALQIDVEPDEDNSILSSYGARMVAKLIGANDHGALSGIRSDAHNDGTGGLTSLSCFFGRAYQSSSADSITVHVARCGITMTAGAVTLQSSAYIAEALTISGGTILRNSGYQAANQGGSGVTTGMGVYIEAQSGATNNWSLVADEGVIVIGQRSGNPSGIPSNTAGIFSKDVAGTCELFTFDEAGNVTQQTPHANIDDAVSAGIVVDDDDPFPRIEYEANVFIGIEAFTYTSPKTGAYQRVTRDLPAEQVQDWDANQIKLEREAEAEAENYRRAVELHKKAAADYAALTPRQRAKVDAPQAPKPPRPFVRKQIPKWIDDRIKARSRPSRD